ncbi:MAG: CDP-alcohol phosphatidyltransferase family protein [Phycisphaerales bacterium]|nr:MAG: CDP-alcohol phosphatidyltransferase family protein [Phycisphaerales bacterium]
MRAKIKEAKESAQQTRIEQGGLSWYSTHFVRGFSIYISYAFVKLGISANSVTVMSGAAGLCGSLCMIPRNLYCNLAGAVLWQLWYILDNVDGEVARLRNRCSLLGVYLDEITHIIVNSTFVLALGLHVWFAERSTLNLFAAIAIYSAWHWKREIQRLMKATLVVKGGLEKNTFVIRRGRWATLLSRVMLSFRGEVESTLFVTAIIIISHAAGVAFARWSLYVYTALLLAYVGAVTLRDAMRVHKKENLRVPRYGD